jgi:hypothetical protein
MSVNGDLSIGKNISVTCDVNFDYSLVVLIKWSKYQIERLNQNNTIYINGLTAENHNETITCDIKYSTNFKLNSRFKSINKSLTLQLKEFDDSNNGE